jgi:zinc transport system permease protein
MPDMLEAVLLFRQALYGTLVIGIACGLLGVYVVLRRIIFVGAALAQISSAGIAFALWLTGMGVQLGWVSRPVVLSLVVTLLGALLFGLEAGRRLVPHDATIGISYAVAGAIGILLISKATVGEAHDVFLQGSILGITQRDTLLLLAVSVPVLALHVLFYKEFLFISFDREMARTLGYRVRRWTLLLYLSLGVVIVAAMQFAGVLLVFNYLVLPAVTGLLLARSMAGAFAVAGGAAALASATGFVLSVPFDLPSGAAIIAASGALVVAAWVVRTVRGA